MTGTGYRPLWHRLYLKPLQENGRSSEAGGDTREHGGYRYQNPG